MRLPDPASIEAVLARLPTGSDEAALAAALTEAFPGFPFSTSGIDEQYWRDTRSVVAADGTRIAEYRPWMEAELAKDNGDIGALWTRLRESDLQISEWHGNSVYAFAPTGPGAADYVQIRLGLEVEWRAGPIVNPTYRPWGKGELLDPSWITHEDMSDDKVIAGPLYRMLGRPGSSVVHVRSFLTRCARLEREKREAQRPEMERRVVRETTREGTTETPFLELVPDWFEFVPRETRFFQDWEESSASAERVYVHWALDIYDYDDKGTREIGFVPRPRHLPEERLIAGDASVHILMDRVEAIDREVGVPFGWFFLMTHGNRVAPEVGQAIAKGLRSQRVVLPDRDARVLLRWAERSYGF
ncbi:hypothetical protein JEY40_03395 [Bradyrhizobium japonicum]|jgi:hypothetical protein|nr:MULTISPECIES: hypothetical protein [Bradyrhizobium]AHY56394.1 hypothetical protein BJS_08592 [Bradyrhizobium japonicum SEMIA 5079]AWL93416.1 hypothetical protein CIT37_15540 [Bradyrhizobium ottawaense]AWO94873.1 hypothetical protein DI395_44630 [Bradyrhizobium diazoefficiens]MCA1402100.1 hypothetical protein [Bradyrhizobium sp. BRP56]NLS74794.1 hypothetical protein [Bradyrhizobium brasilense]QOZ14470.1 hypothetical protein XI02_05025 [Bradyrhizobium sp. CCBAU 21365]UQD85898.1 hypothetical